MTIGQSICHDRPTNCEFLRDNRRNFSLLFFFLMDRTEDRNWIRILRKIDKFELRRIIIRKRYFSQPRLEKLAYLSIYHCRTRVHARRQKIVARINNLILYARFKRRLIYSALIPYPLAWKKQKRKINIYRHRSSRWGKKEEDHHE